MFNLLNLLKLTIDDLVDPNLRVKQIAIFVKAQLVQRRQHIPNR